MQAILLYLLKSIICCGILLGYYWVALRNKQFHYYNRFYLLFSLMVSLFVPALNIDWFSFESSSDKAIALLNVLYMQQEVQDVTVQVSRVWNWRDIAFASGVFISFAMLVLLLFRIAKIYRLKKNYPQTSMDEFDFINTDLQQAPFSFLNNLFWRSDLSMEDATGRQIMQHEITHIKQKHTWDKLFVEAVLSICWMNPFIWLMRRELWLIHEFIADEQSVKDKDASAFAAMLLRQQYGNQIFSPAQPFNYSPIKRRLQMLTTSKEPRYSYARRLMSLPLLALVIFLFAFRLHKKDDVDFNAVKDSAMQYEVAQVIDDTVTKADEEMLPATVIQQDTVKTFGTYEGKKVIDVFVNADNSKVILTFEDNSTKKVSYEEAKQNGIKIERANTAIFKDENGNGIQVRADDILVNTKNENQPLYVLNGKIIEAQDFKKLSPDNIESISVLKDGTATLKYGDKAKNGVIEITTKNLLVSNTPASNICVIEPDNLSPSGYENAISAFADHGYKLQITINGDNLVVKLESSKGKVNDSYSINSLKNADNIVIISANEDNIAVKAQPRPAIGVKSSEVVVKDVYIGPQPVAVQAKFPGGTAAWQKYLERNLQADIPVKNGAPAGRFTVVVSFIVDADGSISDVRAISDPGYGTAAEAVRMIKHGPKWVPATQKGKKINYLQKQSITFEVSEG